MKADGIEYEERMERLQDVTYPKPLEELLLARLRHLPHGPPVGRRPPGVSRSRVVRDMYERAMTFTELHLSSTSWPAPRASCCATSASAYKALEQTVPDDLKSEDLQDLIAWLGEMVRQVDSSLLDEWEQLANPEVETAEQAQEEADQVKPVTANARAFRVLVRNAMFRRVELAALDEVRRAGRAGRRRRLGRRRWGEAMDAYWDEHEELGTGPDARGPKLLPIEEEPGRPVAGPAGLRRPGRRPRLGHQRRGRPRGLRRGGPRHRPRHGLNRL